MTAQIRNSELVNLLRGDYFARSEPNASWVHFQSAIMQLPALRGYWPMGAHHYDGNNVHAIDVATGHDLTLTNTPTFGYLLSATETALPPWINFASASTQYLASGADDAQHDILGTETYVSTNERGLTLGGWFKFTTVPASIFGLMSKFYTVGDQRAYRLVKGAANRITLSISSLGTAASLVELPSTSTVTTGQWYFLVGRFVPSTTMDIWLDDEKTTLAAGIPAAIFNSTEPFEIGRNSRTFYMNGKASNCFLCAAQLSDGIINALWEQSRVMYGKGG